MSKYMVLVDSSVWIEYFKSGNIPALDRLIEENLVCINEIILTELAPELLKQGESEVLEGLEAIEMIPLKIDWEIIRRYQLMNLERGVNKVGIPDLMIMQQVIEEKLSLFSLDKHFKLLQNHLNFDLFPQ
ncbi:MULTISPECIES: PIN domain-containing protein [Gracilimonas]|uniref:PIN domain-containing protein n=1 Tax=Gracilimonas sediminicola TaxID=2952158 RepID=A0A9X2L304_9BACT|nr:PIN domain-containing protein [Gracilimonas sediminicola]MCP9291390.1 PIN domain-containing protein [Gracilimonas sediminicola]